ncbi:stage V sporulation protein E [Bacillaceae bacterium]
MTQRGIPDFFLLFLTLLIVGFGITMVYSSSTIIAINNYNGDYMYFVRKQTLSAAIGFFLLLVAMNVPYQVYKKLFLFIMLGSVALLALVFIDGIGVETKLGVRSWIGIGPFTLQPAEFAKLGIIIYLSALIAKKKDKMQDFSRGLLPALLVTALFFALIMLQPDFGTAALLLMTALTVIYCGGAKLKHLLLLSVPVVLFAIIVIAKEPYRLARITAFLDPWQDALKTGFNLIHSYYAISHGGISGVGFGKSIEKFLYLPNPQTDFIFSVMAEELGFIGVFIFFLFYLALLWRILLIALRCKDPFANLVGIGIFAMIAIQALINVGGVTGSIPLTGVPLPFISYGGSSLMANLLAIGIVLSISREVNKQKQQ